MAGTVTRSWAYSYDPADRLTQALASPGGTYAYTLDAADNLLEQQTPTGTASSTYNALNQLVQRAGQPLAHDAAGNLTDDGTRTYAYDAEQRLVRIGYTGTSRTTTFRYDGLGRRTAVVEHDGTTATETRYLWCGERLCQARDATDTVTRRYYDEGELAVAATGDVAAFYAEDHLGSVRDLRLGDGQVLASYDYDPYGTPTRSDETGGIRADYRYAGLVNHAQSGLYLANYRGYSAQTGRWISRDPIGEAGGVNLYAYAANNPLSWLDPLGLAPYDSYSTPDAAGKAGVRDINPTSIREDVEYAGRICRYTTGGCFYTPPNRGSKTTSYDGVCPKDTSPEGSYHTHSNNDPRYDNENFSKEDKKILDKDGTPGYLGTPSGIIKKYSPIPGSPYGGPVSIMERGAR